MNRQHIEAFLPMLGRITIYQNIVIAVVFLWGLYALMGAEPPTYVSKAMSNAIYAAWVAMHLASPTLVWVGQILKDPLVKWPMQFAGHLGLFVLAITYVIAVRISSQDFYQVLVFIGFALCTLLLATGDVIKLARSEGWCGNGNDDIRCLPGLRGPMR